ncbi:MAG: hypothetical protein GY866_33455 [Proteobacteria bacterium]|nr:hypothetical protein [Pseudomonadota bacterium]
MSWEDLKPVFKPENVQTGIMEVDPDLCTQCEQCLDNCPGDSWELDEYGVPQMKAESGCISCYNCMVVCEVDALSIVETYQVKEGFWATDPLPLEHKLPLAPKDAQGQPDEWNAIEKAIMERRSVRNYTDESVPDALIWRVIEAGRFAPSAGNCQPWKFVVVKDRALIKEMEDAIVEVAANLTAILSDEEQIKNLLVPMYEASPSPGRYDTRVQGGTAAVGRRVLPVFLNAPVVILMACDDRAIGGREQAIGICGQNMNLVANSLGIKSCWVGFSAIIEMLPHLKEKLGLKPPWTVTSSLVLGYPKFKQEGVVPREFRPVTWFGEDSGEPEQLTEPKD